MVGEFADDGADGADSASVLAVRIGTVGVANAGAEASTKRAANATLANTGGSGFVFQYKRSERWIFVRYLRPTCMVDVPIILELAGYALGAIGAVLVFFEFFQIPNYIEYDPDYNDYTLDISPMEVKQHTWIGRVGAFCLAVAFALEFFATFLAQ